MQHNPQVLCNRVLDHLALLVAIDNVARTAEQLGMTRPSLSRLLSELLDEGRIVKDSKGYHLKS